MSTAKVTLQQQSSAAVSTSAADFSDAFTEVAKRRQNSPLRAMMPFLSVPGMISLGGGLPNPQTFPITKITLEMNDGKQLQVEGKELQSALQYTLTSGFPPLQPLLAEILMKEHGTVVQGPERSHEVTVTTGGQSGLARVFELFLTDTESILLDEAAYSGALAFLRPLGCELATVRTDDLGIIPDSLAEVLDTWPTDGSRGKRPRLLYTVPFGANPGGTSMTEERKRQIYEICSRPENNILILEDDPYYFLQFRDDESAPKVPSFLSMDVDRRVVRFDSFSKVMSAGIRVGYCTAPPHITERLRLHMQSTVLHTSALPQAVVAAILKDWTFDGFVQRTKEITAFYKGQRDAFLASANKHLAPVGDGKITWTVPSAGMFVWINLEGATSLSFEHESVVTRRRSPACCVPLCAV